MTSPFPLQFVCFSVPRHLPMKHNLLAVVVDLDNGITPAEIGIQMIEPNRHLHCYRRGVKPSSICRYHRRSPVSSFALRTNFEGSAKNLSCRLESADGPLDNRRNKRLLETLNPHTSHQLGSQKQQSSHNWNLDLHDIH